MSCVGREADLFSSPLFIRRGHSADHPGFILSVIIIDLVSTFLTFSLFVCHPAHDLVMSLNQIWRDGYQVQPENQCGNFIHPSIHLTKEDLGLCEMLSSSSQ